MVKCSLFNFLIQGSSQTGYTVIEQYKQCTLIRSEKWLDAILSNPRLVENRTQYFRVFRFPTSREAEAKKHFPQISEVLHELDIASLYTQNVLQLILNALKKVTYEII